MTAIELQELAEDLRTEDIPASATDCAISLCGYLSRYGMELTVGEAGTVLEQLLPE